MGHSEEDAKREWHDQLLAKFEAAFPFSSKSELEIAERISTFLLRTSLPATEAQIMATVIGKKTTKVSVLRRLLNSKVVYRTPQGNRGNPFLYHTDPLLVSGKASAARHSLATTKNRSPSVANAEAVAPEDTEAQSPLPSLLNKIDAEVRVIYKRLKLPDGEILEVTKEEFDRIVGFYRNLHTQALANPNLLSTEKKN